MLAITYSKYAIRALRRMPRNDADRIRGKIAQLAADPKSQRQNVKQLQGRDGYRLRVGDYRVIFEISDSARSLAILDIGPRGSIYLLAAAKG